MSRRTGWGLAATAAVALTAGIALAAPGDTTRVSVANDGSESPTGGFRGVTSGNGRFVVFVSAAPLAGVPTGGKNQLYIRDRRDGTTRLVSASAAGTAANDNVLEGDFFNPFLDLTPDGRYVVFPSAATNLVPGDANAVADVFRKDMATGQVVLVSVSSSGTQANAAVIGDPSISADGSRVAFNTGTATSLFTDASTDSDIALRDLAAGTTTRLSETAAGVAANSFSERPAISADGSRVAFETGATNLFTNDANAVNDIMVKTIAGGAIVPADVVTGKPAEGADVPGANIPDISGDGRYVVFSTAAALDPTVDTNGATDVYRRDLTTGTSTLVSGRNGIAAPGNQGGQHASIDADGDRVAFASMSTDLVTGDANASNDIFMRTISTSATARASVKSDGGELAVGAETPSVSGDGGVVAFSGQGQYTPEAGADDDVFAHEFTPSDAAGPTIDAGAVASGVNQLTIGGRVADPSGIGRLSIGTVATRPAADGTFSLKISGATTAGAAATNVAIEAMDGAGNLSTRTLTFSPPIALVTSIRVARAKRKVTVRLVLSARSTVTTVIQRRSVLKGKVRWLAVTKPVKRVLLRGKRTVVVTLPNTRRGNYRVRATAKRGTTTQVVLRGFVIR